MKMHCNVSGIRDLGTFYPDFPMDLQNARVKLRCTSFIYKKYQYA